MAQEKGGGNEDIIIKTSCLSSPAEEAEVEILGKWFIEKGSEVRRSGQGKVLSKDVVAVKSGLRLIPPRTWSTNDTMKLSYFDAGCLAFIPSHQAVIGWGHSGGVGVKLQTSLSIVACLGGGYFFWEGGSCEPLMARNWCGWCTSPIQGCPDQQQPSSGLREPFSQKPMLMVAKEKGPRSLTSLWSHCPHSGLSLRTVSDVREKVTWVLKDKLIGERRAGWTQILFKEMLSVTLLHVK